MNVIVFIMDSFLAGHETLIVMTGTMLGLTIGLTLGKIFWDRTSK